MLQGLLESCEAAPRSGADWAPAPAPPSKRAYVGLLFGPCVTLGLAPGEEPGQGVLSARVGLLHSLVSVLDLLVYSKREPS